MKAILELEMPESCEVCNFNVDCACYAFETVTPKVRWSSTRAPFCPLKIAPNEIAIESKKAIDLLKSGTNMPDIPHTYDDMNRAVEVAIFALERQMPQKPIMKKTPSEFPLNPICPSCSRFIHKHEKSHGKLVIPCCKWCGQYIDWSGDDGE